MASPQLKEGCKDSGLRIFRISGFMDFRFRVKDVRLRVEGLGFRAQG